MNMQEATSIMKADSYKMAALSEDTRNNILVHVKDALITHKDEIFVANAKDMAAAEENGIAASVKKRLKFDEHKLADVTNGIDELIKLLTRLDRSSSRESLTRGWSFRESPALSVSSESYSRQDRMRWSRYHHCASRAATAQYSRVARKLPTPTRLSSM